jgi:hypothetical protein
MNTLNHYFAKTGLLLLIVTMAFTACKDEAKEKLKLEREVKRLIGEAYKSPTAEFTMEREKKDQYLATMTLENGTNLQVIANILPDTIILKETLNSMLARRLSYENATKCIAVSLKPANTNIQGEFSGEATLATGEKIKIFAHEEFGWRPANDKATLETLTRLQIMKFNMGQDTIVKLTLENDGADSVYIGQFENTRGEIKRVQVVCSSERFDWLILKDGTNQ